MVGFVRHPFLSVDQKGVCAEPLYSAQGMPLDWFTALADSSQKDVEAGLKGNVSFLPSFEDVRAPSRWRKSLGSYFKCLILLLTCIRMRNRRTYACMFSKRANESRHCFYRELGGCAVVSRADQSIGESRKFDVLVLGRRVQNCHILIVQKMILGEDIS